MEFKVAIESICSNALTDIKSEEMLLDLFRQNVQKAFDASQNRNRGELALSFEELMKLAMIAFKKYGIDSDAFVLKHTAKVGCESQRTMYIYTDRVEIIVDNEVKGGWALWSSEDLVEAFKVAQEFNCKVIKEETEAPKVK